MRLIFMFVLFIAVANAKQHANENGVPHDAHEDHEAFMGSDADKYKDLPPEKAKERLAMLVPKIDKNGDGLLSQKELKDHVGLVHQKFVDEHVQRTWGYYDEAAIKDGKISWQGHIDRYFDKVEESKLNDEQKKRFKRDRRRWTKADTNGDDVLEQEEYLCFIHPEECGTTKDLWVLESLEDMDKNGDGQVTYEEYMTDMFPHIKDLDHGEPWVATEKKTFHDYRDTNKDGKLNFDELKAWFAPPDYDRTDAEANHLIGMADDNKDGALSLEEILKHHEVFVASQVTDYGEQLKKHDPTEL